MKRASQKSFRRGSFQPPPIETEADIDALSPDIDLDFFEDILEQCDKSFKSNSIENRIKAA